MIRTTALAALMAAACSSPPPPQPIDNPPPDQPVDPEVAPQPDTGETVLEPSIVCTAMACAAEKPCCNSCGFQNWIGPSGGAVRSAGEPLPQCEVDGCGRCPFVIYARGERQGDEFVVNSWRRGKPVAQKEAEYTMDDLDAVLKTSGCAAESDCAMVGIGKRLCGGPDRYLVYCKTSTDVAKMEPIVNAINEEAARAAEEQSKQGLSGICAVANPPTISLENGECVGKPQ